MPGIYLKQSDDDYVAMTETAYDAEKVLQRLIGSHPEMLAGDDAGYGALVLVRREAGIGEREGGPRGWSLDHLYLDAKGVPTLVEVKRRGDTRGRREVVGQMLDYAANARTSFSANLLREWLEEDARRRGKEADEVLVEDLGIDAEDVDGYWEIVDTDLQGEHFRLVFVSDKIGRTLRRIVEYLNQQMKTTELLAIEVKQYVDQDGKHQTIVPRVIGARPEKDPPPHRLTREKLLEAIRDHPEATPHAAGVAGVVLDWAQRRGLRIRYRAASAVIATRSPQRRLLRVSKRGNIRFELDTLRKHGEPWNHDSIQQLRSELELEPAGNSPKASPGSLSDENRREGFFRRMEEVLGTLTVEGAADDPSSPRHRDSA